MTLTAILSVSVPAAYRFPQRMHPFQKGRPANHCWGGGASGEKYAITQLITSGKRLVPLLSWVTYFTKKKKKVFCHEKHMNYFIVLVPVKRGGVGEIENAKRKMNLIFLR